MEALYYDGNISTQQWLSKISPTPKTYLYTYDAVSRLTDAKFTSTFPNGVCAPMDYSLKNINYDKNGNILTMQRMGSKKLPNTTTDIWGRIDGLSYAYDATSNKLKSVTDLEGVANPDVGDFRDLNTSGDDYAYDVNGNIIVDKNKGISGIDYDTFLNLPTKITLTTGKSVMYWYDAAGTKLKKTTSDAGLSSYMGALIFEKSNNILSLYQAATDEGRVIPNNTSNGAIYEYNYTDHLGNLRLSFKEENNTAVVVTENVTDPWGLILKELNYNANPNNTNKFDFTGKERQIDFNLNIIDFGARIYDPSISRWGIIDPMAEKYSSLSSYTFSNNNPLRFIDPDGRDPQDISTQTKYQITYNGKNKHTVTQTTTTTATIMKDDGTATKTTTTNTTSVSFKTSTNKDGVVKLTYTGASRNTTSSSINGVMPLVPEGGRSFLQTPQNGVYKSNEIFSNSQNYSSQDANKVFQGNTQLNSVVIQMNAWFQINGADKNIFMMPKDPLCSPGAGVGLGSSQEYVKYVGQKYFPSLFLSGGLKGGGFYNLIAPTMIYGVDKYNASDSELHVGKTAQIVQKQD